jgi:hypothetical protein
MADWKLQLKVYTLLKIGFNINYPGTPIRQFNKERIIFICITFLYGCIYTVKR